jgi:outer membrane immunogenic protein
MRKMIILAIAAAGLSAAPAFAQTGVNFEGFKAGGELSLQRSKASFTAPGNVNLSQTDKGVNFRAFTGYDMMVSDNFLVGAEVGLARGGPKVKKTQGTASLVVDPGLSFDISGRAGFLPSEDVLIYGRLGYANAKVDITATNSAATPTTLTRDKREGGLLLGVGAEMAVSDEFGMRLEYRRAKHGDLKSDNIGVGAYFRF